MADNVLLNAGSGGVTAAADEISAGVYAQRVKPVIGADGTGVDVIPVSNGLDTTATGVPAVGLVGHFDDAATGTVTENQFAPVRISTRRALLVEGVASGTAVPISSATLATAAKQDTIIGHVDGIEGLLTTIDADTSNLSVLGTGTEAAAIRVTIATDSTGVLSVDDNGGSLTVDGTVAVSALPASTNTLEVVGDAAHDAVIAGNPVRLAGRALTADYTAVAAGDTADIITTLLGKLVSVLYANPANTWSYAAASGGITDTTGVTAKAAAGAGVRTYVTRLQVINGHASTSTDVQIRDGASGTVLWRGYASSGGGGVTTVFDPPLRGTANTLVEVACGTTGTATYFNLQGFTAAE